MLSCGRAGRHAAGLDALASLLRGLGAGRPRRLRRRPTERGPASDHPPRRRPGVRRLDGRHTAPGGHDDGGRRAPARRVGEDREPLGRRRHRAATARPAADTRAIRRDPVHLSALAPKAGVVDGATGPFRGPVRTVVPWRTSREHTTSARSGRVLIKTGRAGLAAKVGHDLTIEITRWSARVTVPDGVDNDGGVTASTLTADLDLGSLAVREGTAALSRSPTGTGATSGTPRARSWGARRRRLASPPPGDPVARAAGRSKARSPCNGTSRPVRLQVISPAPGRYRGPPQVRQSDFGITPTRGSSAR